MPSGFTLQIPYDQLLLLVMALFMGVGALRGWYREFISTAVLVALAVFLIEPQLATPVVRYISELLRIVVAFVRSGFSLNLSRLASVADETTLPFDASNPYMFFIIALVIFVLVSYATGGSLKKVTALSRLLGGLLGLFNGYLVISLFKEYALKYFQKASPGLAAAGTPGTVGVAVANLPATGFLGGRGGTVVLALLALMVGVLLISMISNHPIGKR